LSQNGKKIGGVVAVAIILYVIKQLSGRRSGRQSGSSGSNILKTDEQKKQNRAKSSKGTVDKEFFRRLKI